MNAKPVIVTFKLFPSQDDDLIDFLKSLGSREKSSYIRLAIRQQFIVSANLPPYSFAAKSSIQNGSALEEEQTEEMIDNVNKGISVEELDARVDCW